jgi:hypothetical protein
VARLGASCLDSRLLAEVRRSVTETHSD